MLFRTSQLSVGSIGLVLQELHRGGDPKVMASKAQGKIWDERQKKLTSLSGCIETSEVRLGKASAGEVNVSKHGGEER